MCQKAMAMERTRRILAQDVAKAADRARVEAKVAARAKVRVAARAKVRVVGRARVEVREVGVGAWAAAAVEPAESASVSSVVKPYLMTEVFPAMSWSVLIAVGR